MTHRSTLRAHGSASRKSVTADAYSSTSPVVRTSTAPSLPRRGGSTAEVPSGHHLRDHVPGPGQSRAEEQRAVRAAAPEHCEEKRCGRERDDATDQATRAGTPCSEDDADEGENARLKRGRT